MENLILSSLGPKKTESIITPLEISLDNPEVYDFYRTVSEKLGLVIESIYEKNPEIGNRLGDYMRTKLNWLDNYDILLGNGIMTPSELKDTTKLYLYSVIKILECGVDQTINILKQHTPECKGTSANLKSIEIAFGNMTLTNNNNTIN